MNKSFIKNFAIWARNKLIADISYRAGLMGITADGIKNALPQSTGTTEFYDIGTAEPYSISGDAVKQRRKLVEVIRQKEKDTDYQTAYKYIIEEVAYTWFNRLIAIRFMEVNDYLPSHIRVLSSDTGKLEPDIVTNPFDAELDFTGDEEQIIMQLKNDNQLDDLFRMLFIKQCNALNALLPALFEKTKDYTEVLLNLSVIDQEGVIYKLVHDIDEDDFNIEKGGQVEIIGWLYQYYNTELNELVYDGSMSKSRISKEYLPAATTIYTPDWSIRYMVQNSLGKLWLEGHPNDELKKNWKYYLDEAEQAPEVQEKLVEIRREYSALNPEDLKCIDPCMGSGHILVYLFDVLMQIYESQGYSQRDAVQSILQNNLYGLDIDDRAAQIAYFAVMMKARQYDRRILTRGLKPNVLAIAESNGFNRNQLHFFGKNLEEKDKNEALTQINSLLDRLYDAKEYGSIILTDKYNWDLLFSFANQLENIGQLSLETFDIEDTKNRLLELIEVGRVLSDSYDVVVTNPPYFSSSRFDAKLSEYVKKYYSNEKADLSMVMLKRAISQFAKNNGRISFITTSSWMFLSSFEKLRSYIFENSAIDTMVDFGTELFEGKVGHNPIVSWVLLKNNIDYKMKAIRLVDYCYSRRDEKESEFFDSKNLFIASQSNFNNIPGKPIAYWLSDNIIQLYDKGNTMESIAHPKVGMQTSNNDKYLRLWPEICFPEFANNPKGIKWIKYLKGGAYRKWYGNLEYLLRYNNSDSYILQQKNARVLSQDFLKKKKVTWTDLTSGNISFRYAPDDTFYDISGHCYFPSEEDQFWLLAYSNSKIFSELKKVFNSTFHCQVGDVAKIVVPELTKEEKQLISNLARECVEISKKDWDSFETSWDFKTHPLVEIANKTGEHKLEECFAVWKEKCEVRFKKMNANEEQINSIFIDVYGLNDEMDPAVLEKDVSIRQADICRDIKSLISYAVGCMFGRYSLDIEGLAYAGGEWDESKYKTFIPDTDNVLPITDEEYLEDDIVGMFCAWLKKVFGDDSLEANLDFITNVLGEKGNSNTEILRNYFLNSFFKDHCKIYQKRPIYWLFDKGVDNGFKALVYLHRYTSDTIGNLRVDYLHKMQRIYESEINRMQDTIDHSTNSREAAAATKRKEKLQKQLKECREYDEKIGHLALSRIELDLDDGVKKNYRKVQTASDGKFHEVLADSNNIMAKEK